MEGAGLGAVAIVVLVIIILLIFAAVCYSASNDNKFSENQRKKSYTGLWVAIFVIIILQLLGGAAWRYNSECGGYGGWGVGVVAIILLLLLIWWCWDSVNVCDDDKSRSSHSD